MTSKSEDNEALLSFEDMTYIYKFFLRLLAILPFEGRNINCLRSQLLIVYNIILSIIHWSMYVFYIINERKTISIDGICETILVVGINIRYYLLLNCRIEFFHLFNESFNIWRELDKDDHRTVRQFEQKIRLLFKFLFVSCIIANSLYSLSAIMFTINATTDTTSYHNDTPIRVLPFKWYSRNGPYFWPGYKITFACETLVILNAGVVATSVDTAVPLLIMIAAGYFRVLENRFLTITESDNYDEDDSSSVYFKHFILLKLHQRILLFCLRLEKITRTMFFVQLLCTGYNISLAGIKIASSDPDRFKFVPILILNLSQLFICQWAPDHLTEESGSISTAAYFASLIWMKHQLGKPLILVMAISQKPVQMTAAGVVYLSIEKFGSMLTSALSFFTVLRNFNI